jgi:hypothetical protein
VASEFPHCQAISGCLWSSSSGPRVASLDSSLGGGEGGGTGAHGDELLDIALCYYFSSGRYRTERGNAEMAERGEMKTNPVNKTGITEK